MTLRKQLIALVLCFGTLSMASYGRAQDSQLPQPSLADAARKAREQQKNEPKSAKVYTDEDLESLKGQISIVGSEPATAPAPAEASAKAATAAKEPVKDEAYWRKTFAGARRTLADDQREADVLQREYGLKQVQFYSNPDVALREQYSRKDLDDTLAELNAKKQDVEKDNQAISDLQDDLRRAGGEPGWADAPNSNAQPESDSSSSESSPSSSSAASGLDLNSPADSGVTVPPAPDRDGAPTAPTAQPQ